MDTKLEKMVGDFFKLVKTDSRDYASAYNLYSNSPQVSSRINELTTEIVKRAGTANKLTEEHADVIWLTGFYTFATRRNPQLKEVAKKTLYPDGYIGVLKELKVVFLRVLGFKR